MLVHFAWLPLARNVYGCIFLGTFVPSLLFTVLILIPSRSWRLIVRRGPFFTAAACPSFPVDVKTEVYTCSCLMGILGGYSRLISGGKSVRAVGLFLRTGFFFRFTFTITAKCNLGIDNRSPELLEKNFRGFIGRSWQKLQGGIKYRMRRKDRGSCHYLQYRIEVRK